MAETAESLIESSGWLPEPLRTPGRSAVTVHAAPESDADLNAEPTGNPEQDGERTGDEPNPTLAAKKAKKTSRPDTDAETASMRRRRPPNSLPRHSQSRQTPKPFPSGPPAMAGLFRSGDDVMSEDLDDLTHALARAAEAVCRHYLSHGVRRGRYWLVGDIRNTPGRSLFVRLAGAQFGKGAIGKWRDAATAEYGDLLDIIRERSGLRDFGDVVREARQFLNLPRSKPTPADAQTSPWTPRASMHSARRLFAASRPISRTLPKPICANAAYQD